MTAQSINAKPQHFRGSASLVTLTIVSIIGVSLAAGAILGVVFMNELHGAYNKADTYTAPEGAALNLAQATQSGGLVINK